MLEDRELALEQRLRDAIPEGDALRGDLDQFFADRFDSDGRVRTDVQPSVPFTPGLITEEESLAHIDISVELSRYQLTLLAWDLAARSDTDIVAPLRPLSRVQRARAASWLAEVRVAMHDLVAKHEAADRPDEDLELGLARVDRALGWLYRNAAEQIPDAQALRDLTEPPPASQERQLRAAFTPPAPPALPDEGEPETFADWARPSDGPGASFRERLTEALVGEIDLLHDAVVAGRGSEEHDREGALYPRRQIEEIARLAREWTNTVLGHLGRELPDLVLAEPGQPGHLYDAFAYQEWSFDTMNDAARRDEARWWLLQQLGSAGPAGTVLREHHANPSFDEHDYPQNAEARVIDEVVSDLVGDPAIAERILSIHRGWSGLAIKEERKILLRMFRESTISDDRSNLYDLLQSIIHGTLQLLEDRGYEEHTDDLPGERERGLLARGWSALLTEMVWGHGQELMSDPAYLRRVRDTVESDLADENPLEDVPDPADTRFRSHAEATDLIRMRGFPNVLASFLLGEPNRITGPRRGAPRTLLAPFSRDRRTISELSTPPPGEPGPSRSPSLASPESPPPSPPRSQRPKVPPIITRRLRPVSGPNSPTIAPAPATPVFAPEPPAEPETPARLPLAPAPLPPRPGRLAGIPSIRRGSGDTPGLSATMVRAPGTGSCLLYSVIAAAPDVVREQLIEHGFLTERDPIAAWLARPGQVASDSESLARFHSETGHDLPRNAPLWQAGEQLRQLTLRYLQDNRAVLPEAVQQVRRHFSESVGRRIRGLPPEGLIPALRRRGVTYVADAAYVSTGVLRQLYLRERTSELAGPGGDLAAALIQAEAEVRLQPGSSAELADQALSPQAMLNYLASRDVRIQLDVLDHDALRDYLLGSTILRSGPLDDIEFDAVRSAVQTWEINWASEAGEAFLPLLAHALGIQARVLQYRRQNPPNSGQWEDAAPFLLQTVGGQGDRAVYLYYNGATHYNGSAPSQPSVAVRFRDSSSGLGAGGSGLGAGGQTRVHHVEGSVLRLPWPVDAIVNAANPEILNAGGISGLIQKRGGAEMERELRAILKKYPKNSLETGQAVDTLAPGFDGVRFVIHAVPPDFRSPGSAGASRWAMGVSQESRDLLAQAYRSALAVADERGLQSVAFPILSGQIFRGTLSVREVEGIAKKALREARTSVRDVYLVRYERIPGDPLPPATSPAVAPASVARPGTAGPVRAPAPALGTPWGAREQKPRRGPREPGPGRSTQRFGGRYGILRQRAMKFLGGDSAEGDRIGVLADVLGEALGWGEGLSDEEWNLRVSSGLADLPFFYGDSYTGSLPGIGDPADLEPGMRITEPGLTRAHASDDQVDPDVPLYVILGRGRQPCPSRPAGTSPDWQARTWSSLTAARFSMSSPLTGPKDARLRILLRPGGRGPVTAPLTADVPSPPESGSESDAGSPGGSPGTRPEPGGPAWRRANRWWSAESGRKTLENEVYSPTAAQRRFLDQNGLRLLWVPAGGDCNFAAVTRTVPPDELRDQIRSAARQRGIELPAAEERDGADRRWLAAQPGGCGSRGLAGGNSHVRRRRPAAGAAD